MKKADEIGSKTQNENQQLLELLKQLKTDTSVLDQKEEFRQKYEKYKHMFLKEKLEKDKNGLELKTLREEQPPIELKDLKAKYEKLKSAYNREQEIKKDREAKYEQLNQEMLKKDKSLNDFYTQIDEIYESSSTLQEQVDKLSSQLAAEKK